MKRCKRSQESTELPRLFNVRTHTLLQQISCSTSDETPSCNEQLGQSGDCPRPENWTRDMSQPDLAPSAPSLTQFLRCSGTVCLPRWSRIGIALPPQHSAPSLLLVGLEARKNAVPESTRRSIPSGVLPGSLRLQYGRRAQCRGLFVHKRIPGSKAGRQDHWHKDSGWRRLGEIFFPARGKEGSNYGLLHCSLLTALPFRAKLAAWWAQTDVAVWHAQPVRCRSDLLEGSIAVSTALQCFDATDVVRLSIQAQKLETGDRRKEPQWSQATCTYL